jgi:ATP-dependent DNA helicase RecQ
MTDVSSVLKRVWGYDAFRPLQREAIDSVIAGRDSLVVLPTGGGKSLCYQVPALVMDGMAVVVSPLISLMKDQVDALRTNGVAASAIHSLLTSVERREAADGIASGQTKILYVSSERLVMPDFVDYLKRSKISFVAIDEAHCISHWGHDFRPEYRQLRDVKQHFPGIAVHAYTATATPQVREDIAAQLGLDASNVIVGSFDRPNLVFRVARRTDELAQVTELIARHPGESGIVYCISRKKVDTIASDLVDAGYKALPYHAGMDDTARRSNQEAFIFDDVDIIVATVAFGMGIDKSNVRYVAHLGMPKSLEHYQQECGRAGRDGLEAECCLFCSGSDFMLWKRMLDGDEENAATALTKLNDMQAFATSATCRRRAILEYFGEPYQEANCGACDICLDETDTVSNATEIAQKILSCVMRLGYMAGPAYTTKVLRGSREQRILDREHDKLSTWGILSEFTEKEIRDWVEQLVGQRYLVKVGDYGVLQVTEEGRTVLDGNETPRLLQPDAPAASSKRSKADRESWDGVDRVLFETLRALRKAIADEREVPAFVVFGDVSLRDMARRRPGDLEGFLLVHGVGRKKCDDLGQTFVDAIRAHCEATGVDMDVDAAAPARPPARRAEPARPKKPNRTTQAAFELFAAGCSVAEVSKQLARAESTTYGYLERFVQDRELTDPSPWVDSTLYARVRDAVSAVGTGALKPIYLHLNEEVPYPQIRIAIACMRNDSSL